MQKIKKPSAVAYRIRYGFFDDDAFAYDGTLTTHTNDTIMLTREPQIVGCPLWGVVKDYIPNHHKAIYLCLYRLRQHNHFKCIVTYYTTLPLFHRPRFKISGHTTDHTLVQQGFSCFQILPLS